jgi:hypothetical protein
MALMLPIVFWILKGHCKLHEVRPTSPALGLHPFADMSVDFIREALFSITHSLEIALRPLIQFIDLKQYYKTE